MGSPHKCSLSKLSKHLAFVHLHFPIKMTAVFTVCLLLVQLKNFLKKYITWHTWLSMQISLQLNRSSTYHMSPVLHTESSDVTWCCICLLASCSYNSNNMPPLWLKMRSKLPSQKSTSMIIPVSLFSAVSSLKWTLLSDDCNIQDAIVPDRYARLQTHPLLPPRSTQARHLPQKWVLRS